MTLNPQQIFSKAADLLEQNHSIALCIIVKTHGSTPASPGAVMLVDDTAQMFGSVGGGCIEAEVRRRACTLINENQSQLLSFTLDHDRAYEDGLICGGTIEIAVVIPEDASALREFADHYRDGIDSEYPFTVSRINNASNQPEQILRYRYTPATLPTLLIAGGGHIGGAVCKHALDLGFHIKVFDERADILSRFIPTEAEHIAGSIHENLSHENIRVNTYIVIATRGHRHDARALHAVINSEARYIGMIGSKRKIKVTFDDLIAEGVDPALLERVHAPIGLDINSVTIPEIAISIVAQLIKIRNTQSLSPITGPEIIS